MKTKPVVALVTPALAAANNGNWQTARRWARMLAGDYEVRLMQAWDGVPADVMLALHARRSAASIAAWSRTQRPLVVALTGTDLYRDLPAGDADALRSLALADRLIVLHEGAPADVPAEHRAKCVLCFQSTALRQTLRKTKRHLRALMVGHLRHVKDPRTAFAAMRLLAARDDIALDHIGGALDDALADEARALMQQARVPGQQTRVPGQQARAPEQQARAPEQQARVPEREQPRYRWLGALPHAATLRCIQRAHVLVHPSAMEGGAHVVMEAVRCGTPVLASRVSGNVGMLGRDYGGYFEPGDAAGLAALLRQLRDDPAMLPALRAQCEQRSPLFEPAREQATLKSVIASLLETSLERR
jgi:glycosyltransferase involved in cell wall biosynthesis